MVAQAMKAGISVIKPLLTASQANGTVKGDLHDISKNLVSMMLEGAGFKVIDLGVDVAVRSLCRQPRKKGRT